MRLWSLHPEYLDSKGLVALWREGLLALEVLKENTRGYRNHPQLTRFLKENNPVEVMKCYLWSVFLEAETRGFHFNAAKIESRIRCRALQVTSGQLEYEIARLKGKLRLRDPVRYKTVEGVELPRPHPLFECVTGPVEDWERIRG